MYNWQFGGNYRAKLPSFFIIRLPLAYFPVQIITSLNNFFGIMLPPRRPIKPRSSALHQFTWYAGRLYPQLIHFTQLTHFSNLTNWNWILLGSFQFSLIFSIYLSFTKEILYFTWAILPIHCEYSLQILNDPNRCILDWMTSLRRIKLTFLNRLEH